MLARGYAKWRPLDGPYSPIVHTDGVGIRSHSSGKNQVAVARDSHTQERLTRGGRGRSSREFDGVASNSWDTGAFDDVLFNLVFRLRFLNGLGFYRTSVVKGGGGETLGITPNGYAAVTVPVKR